MDAPTMPVQTPSEVLGDFEAAVKSASEKHQPILIQGGGHSAVLVPEDDWRAIQETLYLLSIPGMRESIREGLATPISECSEGPGW